MSMERYYRRERQEMGLPQPRGAIARFLDNVPDGVMRTKASRTMPPERAIYLQNLGLAASESSRLGNIPNPRGVNWPWGLVGFVVIEGVVGDVDEAGRRGKLNCLRCGNEFVSENAEQLHTCPGCQKRGPGIETQGIGVKPSTSRRRQTGFDRTAPWKKRAPSLDAAELRKENVGIGSMVKAQRIDRENVKDYGAIAEALFDDPTES